jgi:hypothetical protein
MRGPDHTTTATGIDSFSAQAELGLGLGPAPRVSAERRLARGTGIERRREHGARAERKLTPVSGSDRRTGRRLSPEVIADGVLASYVHDISARHRPVARD